MLLVFGGVRELMANRRTIKQQDLQAEVEKTKMAIIVAELEKIRAQEAADQELGQFVINMMQATYGGQKLSTAMKQVLARDIVKVADDVFEGVVNKRHWVLTIAIESGFLSNAQSPTGPRGLTQVARATFREALSTCGLEDIDDSDVWNPELNLYSGACYFRTMLEKSPNHDPDIAVAYYNRGPNDKDAQKFARTGRLESVEGLKYMAQFNFYDKHINAKVQPNGPVFVAKVKGKEPLKVGVVSGNVAEPKDTPSK